jgi:hypothetical protein
MTKNDLDPKGLIRESYRIDGISAPECRSIFLDWALGVLQTADMQAQIRELLAIYSKDASDHPMTVVLTEGLATPEKSKRRGGRKARLGY